MPRYCARQRSSSIAGCVDAYVFHVFPGCFGKIQANQCGLALVIGVIERLPLCPGVTISTSNHVFGKSELGRVIGQSHRSLREAKGWPFYA